MSDIFKDILNSSESIFKNEIALDPEFTPKLIQFRESEHKYIADCIKPLFQNRTGKNIIIHGSPGIGKTLACKNILKELEETTDDIIPIYVNCWKKNSTYQIVLELCEALNYKFIQNKRTDELITIVTEKLNKKSSVLVFDEVDKIQELDILYNLVENLFRKSIILITNNSSWMHKLDPRLKSRLIPDNLEFKPYTLEETKEILKQRVNYAFNPSTFDMKNLDVIAGKTYALKDLRTGLFLLRESGETAEASSSKKIEIEHIQQAIAKINKYQKPAELDEEEQKILDMIKSNPDKTTPELFELYKENNGAKSKRTFLRKIRSLEQSKLVSIDEIQNIQGKSYKIKPLTEF